MKRVLVWMAIVLSCLSLVACKGEQDLALYVLSEQHISDSMSDKEIGALALEKGRQVLSGNDIYGVDWENQRYRVRPEALPSVSSLTAESGGSALLKATDKDVFIWVLNKRAVYVGGFPLGVGTVKEQRVPYIVDEERYIFKIVTDDKYGEDKRFDKKLYSYFESKDLLKSEL